MMQMRPQKGEGERFLECRYYDDCLDLAALKNWKAFNCEGCPFYISIFKASQKEVKEMPEAPQSQQNTRICETCGKKITMSPKHRFCASCTAKMVKNRVIPNVKPTKEKDKPAPEAPQHKESSALTIDFGSKYDSLLREVERLAEEEVRSVELQVIYILKRYLKGDLASKT